MIIKQVTTQDINSIFKLYKMASSHQKSLKNVVVWPDFDTEMVNTEINENRQFKLIIDNTIVCIWAITFKDTQIWEGSENDKALYIHRIATNPNFRGQGFVSKIVAWAKPFAIKHNLDYIRLDTLGNNTKLIEVYKASGFKFLGLFDLKNTEGLPAHYHNKPACLFEIKIC